MPRRSTDNRVRLENVRTRAGQPFGELQGRRQIRPRGEHQRPGIRRCCTERARTTPDAQCSGGSVDRIEVGVVVRALQCHPWDGDAPHR